VKACFLTLGCKVNQTESEALAQLAVQEGHQVVRENEDPDIVIINTCSVTAAGGSKSRKLIRRIIRKHPESLVAVMGCYSQISPGQITELSGVDLIMGTQDRRFFLDYLKNVNKKESKQKGPVSMVRDFDEDICFEELPLIENESRARAMLKIQDGCSQFCSYCIVPYTRGPSRSRESEKVLTEAEKLLRAGYREIVLTGIHIGAYGRDLPEGPDLAGLISKLLKVEGMSRLRLGSIEPMEFTEELLEVITSSEAICPHFHIPLQSGSNTILAKMKRPYTSEDYARLLRKIREDLPEAAIAADIMTGFPGEGEEEHQETLEFINECDFAGVHAFPYSRRPGTPAAQMPDQIAESVKSRRVHEIIEAGKKYSRNYARRFIGTSMEVLLETIEREGTCRGHTANFLELAIPASLNPGDWQPGQIINCLIQEEYFVF